MGVELKYKILDTNILLADPEKALCYSFRPKEDGFVTYVILPIVVIEELDKFKHEQSERGRNARLASRILKELKQKTGCSLSAGIPVGDNYFVKVATGFEQDVNYHFRKADDDVRKTFPSKDSDKSVDNRILTTAVAYQRAYEDRKDKKTAEVELVTQDHNLVIKADAFGIQANDWEDMHAIRSGQSFYKGYSFVELPSSDYSELFDGISHSPDTKISHAALSITKYLPNEFFRIINTAKSGESLLARNDPFDGGIKVFAICHGDEDETQEIISLHENKYPIKGISPRNYQQAFALEALCDDRINIVHLIGPAGGGKTILTFAVGLEKVDSENLELLVSKPVRPAGPDIGFLPGTEEEKLMPWMGGIIDNLVLLQGDNATVFQLIREGKLKLQALEKIRGRSIHNRFYAVEEAQNLTPKEVKTTITRVGDSSKLVLLGDPEQVDHPALNTLSTGILYSSEWFKQSELSATVYLPKGERGKLATLASQMH